MEKKNAEQNMIRWFTFTVATPLVIIIIITIILFVV